MRVEVQVTLILIAMHNHNNHKLNKIQCHRNQKSLNNLRYHQSQSNLNLKIPLQHQSKAQHPVVNLIVDNLLMNLILLVNQLVNHIVALQVKAPLLVKALLQATPPVRALPKVIAPPPPVIAPPLPVITPLPPVKHPPQPLNKNHNPLSLNLLIPPLTQVIMFRERFSNLSLAPLRSRSQSTRPSTTTSDTIIILRCFWHRWNIYVIEEYIYIIKYQGWYPKTLKKALEGPLASTKEPNFRCRWLNSQTSSNPTSYRRYSSKSRSSLSPLSS